MALGNKLGLTDDIELAHEEERLSKTRALELYDKGLLPAFEVGTFAGLAKIHGYLFQDVYEFAGQRREVFMRGIDASYRYEGYATYSLAKGGWTGASLLKTSKEF